MLTEEHANELRAMRDRLNEIAAESRATIVTATGYGSHSGPVEVQYSEPPPAEDGAEVSCSPAADKRYLAHHEWKEHGVRCICLEGWSS